MNLDHHLSDNLTERDYRAKQERERKVEERVKAILSSVDEIADMLSDSPRAAAVYVRPVMGEDHLDYVDEFRNYMRGLAWKMADDEVQPWEEFL